MDPSRRPEFLERSVALGSGHCDCAFLVSSDVCNRLLSSVAICTQRRRVTSGNCGQSGTATTGIGSVSTKHRYSNGAS